MSATCMDRKFLETSSPRQSTTCPMSTYFSWLILKDPFPRKHYQNRYISIFCNNYDGCVGEASMEHRARFSLFVVAIRHVCLGIFGGGGGESLVPVPTHKVPGSTQIEGFGTSNFGEGAIMNMTYSEWRSTSVPRETNGQDQTTPEHVTVASVSLSTL